MLIYATGNSIYATKHAGLLTHTAISIDFITIDQQVTTKQLVEFAQLQTHTKTQD